MVPPASARCACVCALAAASICVLVVVLFLVRRCGCCRRQRATHTNSHRQTHDSIRMNLSSTESPPECVRADAQRIRMTARAPLSSLLLPSSSCPAVPNPHRPLTLQRASQASLEQSHRELYFSVFCVDHTGLRPSRLTQRAACDRRQECGRLSRVRPYRDWFNNMLRDSLPWSNNNPRPAQPLSL